MNETNALVEIKTTVKPPLTKREVIAATALAMHEEQKRIASEAMKQQAELEKLARAAAKKMALKLCRQKDTRFARFEFCDSWGFPKTEKHIRFGVYFDFEELPEYKAWQSFVIPKVQDVSEIRRELEHCGRQERLSPSEIIKVPGMREKLLELGKKALGIAEAKSGQAIDIPGKPS